LAPGTVVIAASLVWAGLVLVMVKLTGHFTGPPPISLTPEWLDQLSVETTDLLRLIGENGGQSVRTHLPRLRDDFRLICMAVKVIIVQSNRDRPDLAWVLVRSQITFTYGMMMLRFQLVRYRYGL
jgi:hypothetical protein